MIDLYYWPTPNGFKISIMLEECGLPYKIVPVNIGTGEQFKPDFLKISPNNRMPAIVDHEPLGGGRAHLDFRKWRDTRVPRGKNWKIHAQGAPWQVRSAPMALLADGRSRSDGRAKSSFQHLRA